MKCMLCDGEMKKKDVPYTIDRKGYHLYIREIPAHVCTQCNEKYFDENEVEGIQVMIKTLEQYIEKLKAA